MQSKFLLAAVFSAAALLGADVKMKSSPTRIEITIDGEPFSTFHFGPDAPKPYLDPLRAPDGTIVTRRYPMNPDVPGEAHDHPHHRGLWFTHGDVNGFDFWANEFDQKPRDTKGRVVLKGVHQAADGLIRADFEWLTPAGEILLVEQRTMRFLDSGGARFIDFDLTLTAAHQAVKFGDTKEGMFAVRIAPTMREVALDRKPGQGVIVNAEGARGEKATWGKRSPWVDYSGPIDGETYGIAIFDHPSNTKQPTFWHVRAYGLFAANPFGEHDFLDDESRDGSLTIDPGQSLRFRYRVMIHPGDAAAADVAKAYRDWTR